MSGAASDSPKARPHQRNQRRGCEPSGVPKAPGKTSTERVRRHRANKDDGMTYVPGFWLNKNETNLLAARGVLKEWNSESQNAQAVTALLRMNLRSLLKF